jgi:hypothetical protein
VQRLPGDEGGTLETEHPLHDIGDLGHATERMPSAQAGIGLRIVTMIRGHDN